MAGGGGGGGGNSLCPDTVFAAVCPEHSLQRRGLKMISRTSV